MRLALRKPTWLLLRFTKRPLAPSEFSLKPSLSGVAAYSRRLQLPTAAMPESPIHTEQLARPVPNALEVRPLLAGALPLVRPASGPAIRPTSVLSRPVCLPLASCLDQLNRRPCHTRPVFGVLRPPSVALALTVAASSAALRRPLKAVGLATARHCTKSRQTVKTNQ